jgi:hypothetical protein
MTDPQRTMSHPECAVCQKRLAYQRTLRARYRRAGGCTICGKPCEKFTRCLTHRKAVMRSHFKRKAAA